MDLLCLICLLDFSIFTCLWERKKSSISPVKRKLRENSHFMSWRLYLLVFFFLCLEGESSEDLLLSLWVHCQPFECEFTLFIFFFILKSVFWTYIVWFLLVMFPIWSLLEVYYKVWNILEHFAYFVAKRAFMSFNWNFGRPLMVDQGFYVCRLKGGDNDIGERSCQCQITGQLSRFCLTPCRTRACRIWYLWAQDAAFVIDPRGSCLLCEQDDARDVNLDARGHWCSWVRWSSQDRCCFARLFWFRDSLIIVCPMVWQLTSGVDSSLVSQPSCSSYSSWVSSLSSSRNLVW